MADLDYKKENMKELHAADKKVKAGVYVIAALLVLVYLLPIYVMLNQSFRFMTDLSPRLYLPEKWTLDNYIQAFQNADLWKGMKKLLCLCCGSLYFGNCIRRSCRLRTCTGRRKNLQCTPYCEHLHHDDPEPVLTGRYLFSDGKVPYDQPDLGTVFTDSGNRYGQHDVLLYFIHCFHTKGS